jgi:hypothetical protein
MVMGLVRYLHLWPDIATRADTKVRCVGAWVGLLNVTHTIAWSRARTLGLWVGNTSAKINVYPVSWLTAARISVVIQIQWGIVLCCIIWHYHRDWRRYGGNLCSPSPVPSGISRTWRWVVRKITSYYLYRAVSTCHWTHRVCSECLTSISSRKRCGCRKDYRAHK